MRLNNGMPRKKRPTYTPLEVFVYDDLIVEVYADDELPNGRGMPGNTKRLKHSIVRWKSFGILKQMQKWGFANNALLILERVQLFWSVS